MGDRRARPAPSAGGGRGPTAARASPEVDCDGGRFARLLDQAGLPRPRREHPVHVDGGVRYLDHAYPERMLALEIDGHAYHSSPEQVSHDHRRRNLLTGLGWDIHVFTWGDVTRDPARVVEEIRTAYATAGTRRPVPQGP